MTSVLIKDSSFWSTIYDILIDECGAFADYKDGFVMLNGDFREWRFCGNLGFGGKVWNNNDNIYVNCYSEDMDARRMFLIERTNKKISEALVKYQNQNKNGK